MSAVPMISCQDGEIFSMASVAREPVRCLVPMSVFEENDHCLVAKALMFEICT